MKVQHLAHGKVLEIAWPWIARNVSDSRALRVVGAHPQTLFQAGCPGSRNVVPNAIGVAFNPILLARDRVDIAVVGGTGEAAIAGETAWCGAADTLPQVKGEQTIP